MGGVGGGVANGSTEMTKVYFEVIGLILLSVKDTEIVKLPTFNSPGEIVNVDGDENLTKEVA